MGVQLTDAVGVDADWTTVLLHWATARQRRRAVCTLVAVFFGALQMLSSTFMYFCGEVFEGENVDVEVNTSILVLSIVIFSFCHVCSQLAMAHLLDVHFTARYWCGCWCSRHWFRGSSDETGCGNGISDSSGEPVLPTTIQNL